MSWSSRIKFGVLGPSTNTVVEPDFNALRPEGVTNHYSRIFTPDAQALSNESFKAGTDIISDNLVQAIDSVMTCGPNYMVMGMSALTFYGGLKGAQDFEKRVSAASGLGVSTGSLSCLAALKKYPNVKRIAFLSPYYPVANQAVSRFFTDCGYVIIKDIDLKCKSWTDIAIQQTSKLSTTLDQLNESNPDAIIQVGTNLSMMRLAAEKEQSLGKPVIAINAATYWHALRHNNIDDKISGYGDLMETH